MKNFNDYLEASEGKSGIIEAIEKLKILVKAKKFLSESEYELFRNKRIVPELKQVTHEINNLIEMYDLTEK